MRRKEGMAGDEEEGGHGRKMRRKEGMAGRRGGRRDRWWWEGRARKCEKWRQGER